MGRASLCSSSGRRSRGVLCYGLIRSSRRRGFVHHRVLIVGAGHVGHQIGQIHAEPSRVGLTPVGSIDDNPRVSDRLEARQRPVVGLTWAFPVSSTNFAFAQ